MDFYTRLLYAPAQEKKGMRDARGFTTAITAAPGDWELWAAILFDQKHAAGLYGHDLEKAEVKSGGMGASFEYQYHKNTGLKKLDAESGVAHIFIQHSNAMADVTIRVMHGEALRQIFESWREELDANYKAGKQRFRKSISSKEVTDHGELVLQIKDGKLIEASPKSVDDLLSPPPPAPEPTN